MRAVAFRKSKPKAGCALGWRNFGGYVIISQVNAVILWFCNLGFMREPAGAFAFIKYQLSGFGKDREHAIVIHPW
jgi:hypothetical protein